MAHESLPHAILDAIPAHVAVLDPAGVVIVVNDAWRRFAEANGMALPGYGVGANYIAMCEQAHGDCADEAAAMAQGMRRVLDGTLRTFALEYPCHGPGVRRWFRVSVTPMPRDRGRGALVLHADVTERKLAEEALSASETRFRAIIEQGPDVTTLVDAQGRIRYASRAALDVFGLPVAQYVGRDVFELAHPDDRQAMGAALAALRSEPGATTRIRLRVRHHEGGWRWVEALAANWLNEQAVGAVVVSYRDVTARVEAESALHESQSRLIQILEAMPVGVLVVDASGAPYYVNRVGEEILGVGLAGFGATGAPAGLRALCRAGTGAPYPAAELPTEHALQGEDVYVADIEVRRANGAMVPIAAWSAPVYDADGRIAAAIMAFADVSERRRAEEALHTMHALVRAVVSAAPIIVWAMGRDGIVTVCEGRGLDELGLDPAAAVGRPVSEVLGTETVADGSGRVMRADETVERVLAGETIAGTSERRSASLEHVFVPLRDDAGAIRGMMGISLVVTERKRLEEQLRQAQKMEAVGRLAGGIAHDFNNLLTAILGAAEMLGGELTEAHPGRRDLGDIIRAGRRAADLTHQLLAFSRRQVLRPTVLDLNAVIATLQSVLTRLLGEDIELRTALEPALAPVRADRGQIEQVIMNLAVNARDAMPNGGRLTIETTNARVAPELTVEDGTVPPGDYAVERVRDTGIGMDADTRARIFEPFFTTKALGKGTGLGLSMVFGIVRQSGGVIVVDTAPEQGTTFSIYLPTHGAPTAGRERPAGAAAPGHETLLVVEDDPTVRRLTCKMLEAQGYTVLGAATGAEALDVAAAHDGEIAALITDVVMPGMSGRELAERLQHARPRTGVLFVSGYADDEVVSRGVFARGTAFLQKPFDPITLARKLRAVLDRPAGA